MAASGNGARLAFIRHDLDEGDADPTTVNRWLGPMASAKHGPVSLDAALRFGI